MVRNVPIEEILILIMCICKSYEKNTQHKRQIGRCNCILSPKNIKLQPVAPLMPLEALLITINLTHSDSDAINGGTGCNFIFLLCRLLVVGPVLKWLALILLLCRLLVVGPVLKWLALFIYYCADYL